MVIPKFITDKVAFSPMPYPEDIPELVKEFQAVVVLTYEYELSYNLEDWKKHGVEVLYSPIEDFSAPTLEQLIEIVKWIDEKVKESKKVLIHCFGGSGRSGTIAVAYLMYSKGLNLRDALVKVRSLKPSAVETWSQMDILRRFEKYLREHKRLQG
ncbi:protein tyrosine phosphatase [Thermococcus sp. M39]|uniref:protein-tyrosine phosphatase family protein n=1 Tax=unclassified Thermococcus TaxID=2627626 RepID=UPI00143BAB63|nr:MULTISPECIES: dual specificity protein phosphatase family protein [unclassified Thermococcus]NJE08629.1 protein tyrosine phosphatase [Thermococcus sp. M39]NJE13237.1 protein tyrosine phosphatase [Thermococcus sp. LS2]